MVRLLKCQSCSQLPNVFPQSTLFLAMACLIMASGFQPEALAALATIGGKTVDVQELNRITTTVAAGQGGFIDSVTGEIFIPRGVNYSRLRPNQSDPVMKVHKIPWHATFQPEIYSTLQLQDEFRQMKAFGYNYVRVFLNSDYLDSGGSVTSVANLSSAPMKTAGIPDAYVNMVADFIAKAANNGLYVVLTGSLIPQNYYGMMSEISGIDRPNGYIMNPTHVAAEARFLSDLLARLKAISPALLNAIFAVDIANEATFYLSFKPFSQTTGTFTWAGIPYRMDLGSDRQRLADDTAIAWATTLVRAVKRVDPKILVGASGFTPMIIGHKGFDGAPALPPDALEIRYPIRQKVLLEKTPVDYLDVHVYPLGMGYSLSADLESAEITRRDFWTKPLIMGEHGAVKSAYPYFSSAVSTIRSQMTASCNYGFVGWGFWSWDTTKEESTNADIWNATEYSNAWNWKISPLAWKTVCPMLTPGLFQTQNAIFYANGSHYCIYASWQSYVELTGRTDAVGIRTVSRPPAYMIYDGACHR